ncbi:T9SS type A sorting domain-containing protein [Chryseobacterium aquaeductus]|uniref:T9SS type A sorting domain-containing protein n=1 Tax=Chryseobacterium aquaeductus TaxID=2675056 RepID=UPI0013899EF4|nr:T9SS type A sorting domain-containing protein [Chryseobacterium aquaeductus]
MPYNTNTSSVLSFTAAAPPIVGNKYWTSAAITTTGNINISNNKIYSGTSISMTNGFKASSSGGNVVMAVGNCSIPLAKMDESGSSIYDSGRSIVLYPNPATTVINSQFNNIDVKKIAIYSLSGTLVYQSMIEIGSKSFSIDISHIPESGYIIVYTLKDDTKISKKFIKKK